MIEFRYEKRFCNFFTKNLFDTSLKVIDFFVSIKGMNEKRLWMQKLSNAITKAKEHEAEIEKNNRRLGKS